MPKQTQIIQLKYVNHNGTRTCVWEQKPGEYARETFFDIVDGVELLDRSYGKSKFEDANSFRFSADFEMNYYGYELLSSLNMGSANI